MPGVSWSLSSYFSTNEAVAILILCHVKKVHIANPWLGCPGPGGAPEDELARWVQVFDLIELDYSSGERRLLFFTRFNGVRSQVISPLLLSWKGKRGDSSGLLA
jgi:hypothetical protein